MGGGVEFEDLVFLPLHQLYGDIEQASELQSKTQRETNPIAFWRA
jgi:hypothetical protein